LLRWKVHPFYCLLGTLGVAHVGTPIVVVAMMKYEDNIHSSGIASMWEEESESIFLHHKGALFCFLLVHSINIRP
jgi:hypothetical protein